MRAAPHVREQDHVVQGEQVLRNFRLIHEDIQASARQPAGQQGVNQRVLVHHRSAGNVDQVAAGTERLDDPGVDQPGGPCSARQPLPLGSLDRRPLLMYSTKEARYFHDLVLRLFASAGAHANITQYASQVPALLAFVQAGLGVTLVPASAMAFSPPGVEFHEIDGRHGMQELNRVDLELAWNEETANPAVLRLLELIEEAMPAGVPAG